MLGFPVKFLGALSAESRMSVAPFGDAPGRVFSVNNSTATAAAAAAAAAAEETTTPLSKKACCSNERSVGDMASRDEQRAFSTAVEATNLSDSQRVSSITLCSSDEAAAAEAAQKGAAMKGGTEQEIDSHSHSHSHSHSRSKASTQQKESRSSSDGELENPKRINNNNNNINGFFLSSSPKGIGAYATSGSFAFSTTLPGLSSSSSYVVPNWHGLDLNRGEKPDEKAPVQDAASVLALASAKLWPSFGTLAAVPSVVTRVVTAAKGSFNPPEISAKERAGGAGAGSGWKGSSATSAFRPTKPRRSSANAAPKPLLDFDLNVREIDADDATQNDGNPTEIAFDLNQFYQGESLSAAEPTPAKFDFDLNDAPISDQPAATVAGAVAVAAVGRGGPGGELNIAVATDTREEKQHQSPYVIPLWPNGKPQQPTLPYQTGSYPPSNLFNPFNPAPPSLPVPPPSHLLACGRNNIMHSADQSGIGNVWGVGIKPPLDLNAGPDTAENQREIPFRMKSAYSTNVDSSRRFVVEFSERGEPRKRKEPDGSSGGSNWSFQRSVLK